jgi:hypothetical protein
MNVNHKDIPFKSKMNKEIGDKYIKRMLFKTIA